jgi:3-methyladenine DNA glycosylase AlkD
MDIRAMVLSEVRDVTGATTPAVRAVRRKYSKLLAGESPDRVLAIVNALLAERTWTARVVAYELIAGHAASLDRLNSRLIEEMAAGLADWGSIDLFGVTVTGAAWREGRIGDSHVKRWARSKDRWKRRLALVSTVPLNSKARGGSGDTVRTLAVCRTLVADRDDMVVKALSWALRELSKRDPASVAGFLRKEDARLAPRVRREVRAKLETGRKAG